MRSWLKTPMYLMSPWCGSSSIHVSISETLGSCMRRNRKGPCLGKGRCLRGLKCGLIKRRLMQCSTVATIARMGNIHDGLVRYVDSDIVEGQTGWNICAEFSPCNGQDI